MLRISTKHLRGRQGFFSFENAVCSALLFAFIGMLLLVVSLFSMSVQANSTDEIHAIPMSDDNATTHSSENSKVSNSDEEMDSNLPHVSETLSTSTSSVAKGSVLQGYVDNRGAVNAKYVTGLGKYYNLSYSWKNAPDSITPLYDKNKSQIFVFLPQPSSYQVRAGSSFYVNSDYYKGFEVFTLDDEDEINGKYVFSGWSLSGEVTMPKHDLNITGSWTYQKIENSKENGDKKPSDDSDSSNDIVHTVSYIWTNCPSVSSEAGYFCDIDGNEVALKLPESRKIHEGDAINVDDVYTSETIIYLKSRDNGLIQRKYVFSGWMCPENQVMEKDDIVITGRWSEELVMFKIEYVWENAPDEGSVLYDKSDKEIKVNLPVEDSKVAGCKIELNDDYEVDVAYFQKSSTGEVVGTWTFMGWNCDDIEIDSETDELIVNVSDHDICIYGSWKFESV